mgnify:CR=1 FL=1|tara:strand:+ start:1495 stop:2481 length:987 start_codon:yes stop_codon:yes gene_type:complete
MQTSFIYSTSRVNTLSQYLLTRTEIDRLLVAEPGEDLQDALKETYLAPFIAHVESGDVAEAIEQTLIDAKKLIHRITPYGDMFRVLWLQYDIHNLRVFAKAAAKGVPFDDCTPLLSERGIYESAYLFSHAEEGTLNRLQSEWQGAYDDAVRLATAGELDKVDEVLDEAFFKMAKRVAVRSRDPFIQKYFKAVIDTYNLKARLRYLANQDRLSPAAFVTDGSFRPEEIETREQVLSAFQKLNGENFWDSSVQYFDETGNTTRIDARVDEYLLSIAEQASVDMFTSASLVLYYLRCRQSAANIRTIVVGKNSGMSEEDIRANLRLAYVSE